MCVCVTHCMYNKDNCRSYIEALRGVVVLQ